MFFYISILYHGNGNVNLGELPNNRRFVIMGRERGLACGMLWKCHGGQMLEKLYPDMLFEKITDISPQFLESRGISGIILDIDNTIMKDGQDCPDPFFFEWLESMRKNGIKAFLLSNGSRKGRVDDLCALLRIDGIHKARKPSAKGFREALRMMGLDAGQTAVIGDQIFTDVWGARRAGIFSILLEPISPEENTFVRFKRPFEKFVLKRYHDRKGKLRR
jgi:HAD superfamily phosphatase (TIGR01668 family)